MLILILFD